MTLTRKKYFNEIFFLVQVSYGLGWLLFKENIPLRLGLFFTGVSPAGGASNIWTVLLGGNLDLSITMSTTSTLFSFGMLLNRFFFNYTENKKKQILSLNSYDATMDIHIGKTDIR